MGAVIEVVGLAVEEPMLVVVVVIIVAGAAAAAVVTTEDLCDCCGNFDGSTTVVTRNREDFGKNEVGEQLVDDGGVMGEVPVSMTRDT